MRIADPRRPNQPPLPLYEIQVRVHKEEEMGMKRKKRRERGGRRRWLGELEMQEGEKGEHRFLGLQRAGGANV